MARMVGDMLFLAQADNGLVVPGRETGDLAQQVSELFDCFDALAVDKSMRLPLAGAGLGLAITRSIVRAHDGEISARSGVFGTCFEIRFV